MHLEIESALNYQYKYRKEYYKTLNRKMKLKTITLLWEIIESLVNCLRSHTHFCLHFFLSCTYACHNSSDVCYRHKLRVRDGNQGQV